MQKPSHILQKQDNSATADKIFFKIFWEVLGMKGKNFLAKLLTATILVGGVNFAPAVVNFDAKNLQNVSVAYATSDEAHYMQLANSSMDKQNYNKAIEYFTKVIQINPNNFEAYNGRGLAYLYMQNFNSSVENFTKSIQLNPNSPMAYSNRGISYAQLQKYPQALADFNKAIQLNPNDFEPYNSRGTTYYILKNYNSAIQDFSKVIQLDPNNADAYHSRGLCYKKLGQVTKAQADLAKAKQLGY